MKMKYSRNVVGCRIENDIFIHPELYTVPKLYHAIVQHEQEHSGTWTPEDLKHDLFGHGLDKVKPEFYKFMLSHPRTLLGYLPITKVGKHWSFDIQMALIWLFAIAVFTTIGVML